MRQLMVRGSCGWIKMIYRTVFIVVAASILGGCGPETDGSDQYMIGDDRGKLLQALDAQLFDGRSARIKEIRLAKDHRYCGRINAKNRAGGYTGWQLFSFNANGNLLGMEEQGRYGLDAAACGLTKHL